ncbi:hypothetical protein ACWIWK_07580 [Helicobacter sp. 23-1048]
MELFRIENLDFAYSANQPPVLEHINLRFFSGDFLAITGANGGGEIHANKANLRYFAPAKSTHNALCQNYANGLCPTNHAGKSKLCDSRH